MSIDYKEKYLKYKQKYLELKNQKGGKLDQEQKTSLMRLRGLLTQKVSTEISGLMNEIYGISLMTDNQEFKSVVERLKDAYLIYKTTNNSAEMIQIIKTSLDESTSAAKAKPALASLSAHTVPQTSIQEKRDVAEAIAQSLLPQESAPEAKPATPVGAISVAGIKASIPLPEAAAAKAAKAELSAPAAPAAESLVQAELAVLAAAVPLVIADPVVSVLSVAATVMSNLRIEFKIIEILSTVESFILPAISEKLVVDISSFDKVYEFLKGKNLVIIPESYTLYEKLETPNPSYQHRDLPASFTLRSISGFGPYIGLDALFELIRGKSYVFTALVKMFETDVPQPELWTVKAEAVAKAVAHAPAAKALPNFIKGNLVHFINNMVPYKGIIISIDDLTVEVQYIMNTELITITFNKSTYGETWGLYTYEDHDTVEQHILSEHARATKKTVTSPEITVGEYIYVTFQTSSGTAMRITKVINIKGDKIYYIRRNSEGKISEGYVLKNQFGIWVKDPPSDLDKTRAETDRQELEIAYKQAAEAAAAVAVAPAVKAKVVPVAAAKAEAAAAVAPAKAKVVPVAAVVPAVAAAVAPELLTINTKIIYTIPEIDMTVPAIIIWVTEKIYVIYYFNNFELNMKSVPINDRNLREYNKRTDSTFDEQYSVLLRKDIIQKARDEVIKTYDRAQTKAQGIESESYNSWWEKNARTGMAYLFK